MSKRNRRTRYVHVSNRMQTTHMSENHKPPREQCSQKEPECRRNHYVDVPAITTRGTWPIAKMVTDAEMASLAILYRQLGGERW